MAVTSAQLVALFASTTTAGSVVRLSEVTVPVRTEALTGSVTWGAPKLCRIFYKKKDRSSSDGSGRGGCRVRQLRASLGAQTNQGNAQSPGSVTLG
eukprot:COSAG03_NODE_2511_length_2686_cov_11.679938_3_plen_96_part_00